MTLREMPPLVLVVDDDADIRDTVSEVLIEAGYAVLTVADGSEALAWLATSTPAVILLDVNMPVMNGIEFRRAQLADPKLAAIPTVIMTAIDRVPERIGDLSVDDVLAKPVGLRELLDVVAKHAPRTA